MRKLTLVVLALAIVGAAVFAALRTRGTDSVSASDVAARAEAARVKLGAALGPDSTLHTVEVSFSESRPSSGPWVLPVNTRTESFVYFGAGGNLAALHTETTDADSGALVQTVELRQGQLVYTDIATGETTSHAFNATAEELRDRLMGAVDQVAQVVSPEASARRTNIAGKQAFVVERSGGRGTTRRSYYSASDYVTLRWEVFDAGGKLIESKDRPVFEILPGNHAPS